MAAKAELRVGDRHRLNRLLETALALEAEARNEWLGVAAGKSIATVVPVAAVAVSARI